ncbi:glycosyltransferase [Paenarthrobacter sp. NPDC089989]|uniref:glycosyltransferase n=1 Tax=unclassified Paenarthrobacter TaxID=2634190 RepID=UPI00381E4EF5
MTQTIMYISGGRWDGIPGTDRLLTEALAAHGDVLWVDQPVSVHRYADVRRHAFRSLTGNPEEVTPSISRLRLPALPGFSRPVVRRSTEALAKRALVSSAQKTDIAVVVNSSPVVPFPATIRAPRLLHLTDDWLAASDLLGLSRRHVERVLEANCAMADVITAVSPGLAEKMTALAGRTVELLPNGCRTPRAMGPAPVGRPVAALVGQLNERLDEHILTELGNAAVPLVVVGPRTERDPGMARFLDGFLALPSVDWRGEVPADEVARILQTVAVGLTPYSVSEFNTSSFPLKTLEYLACGVPVVATDLPATRWVGGVSVSIAGTPKEFVDLVRSRIVDPPGPVRRLAIQDSALAHTWDVRAEHLLSLVGKHQTKEPGSTRGPRHVGSK